MPTTIPSPNMSMPVPIVGTDPGPTWAQDVNSCLSILDQHTHAPGSGLQITPAAININSALPFNGNQATLLGAAVFTPGAAVTALNSLWFSGTVLYATDGAGNQVRLTLGGSPAGGAGSITGLPSGTASVSYSGGIYSFKSSSSNYADVNLASIILNNNAGGVITLSPPGGAPAYSLSLPGALPGSTSFVTLDAAGNLGTVSGVSAAQINSASILGTQIAGQTITQDLLALRPTGATAAAGQIALSGPVTATTTSTAYVSVTGLTVTLTTTGRPVALFLQGQAPHISGTAAYLSASSSAGLSGAYFAINRNLPSSVTVCESFMGSDSLSTYTPPGSVSCLDFVPAGTYTYQVFMKAFATTTPAANVTQVALCAYEI